MASYNSLLKPYPHKGLCGDRELVESKAQVAQKVSVYRTMLNVIWGIVIRSEAFAKLQGLLIGSVV